MAKSYEVKPANIFGRLGEGFGRGIAEQLPKEMERRRLAQGLQELSQAKDLDPFQRFAALSSIPGITPQMVQSGSELLKLGATNRAFTKKKDGVTPKPPTPGSGTDQATPEVPSLENKEAEEARRKPFIPKHPDQIEAEQAEKFLDDPDRYGSDISKAIAEGYQRQQQEASINEAFQKESRLQDELRNEVRNNIRDKFKTLGVQIPGDVQNNLEEKAAKSLLPKSEGGEGLTKAQAVDKYGKESNEISRDYQDLETLVGGFLPGIVRTPGGVSTLLPGGTKTFHDSLELVREKFEKRGDLRNFADTLIANGISPEKSYFLSYPLKKEPELAKLIKNAPKPRADARAGLTFENGLPKIGFENLRNETLKLAEEILPKIGNSSPMAVIQSLGKKGYDVDVLKQYFIKNKDQLKGWQADQLNKPLSKVNSLPDLWLFINLGQEEILE